MLAFEGPRALDTDPSVHNDLLDLSGRMHEQSGGDGYELVATAASGGLMLNTARTRSAAYTQKPAATAAKKPATPRSNQ
jgi:hypothetical protein